MTRFVQSIAALLVCLTLGLHWAALQTVAWTAMVVERAQTASLSEALQTTFDGQHPCKLCKVVRAGKSSEKQSEQQLKLTKLEVAVPGEASLFVTAPEPAVVGPGQWVRPLIRSEVPPLPPPRRA